MARRPPVDPKAALAALPGLGAQSAEMLVEAGIADVRTLRRLGPLKAYRRLRYHFGKRVSTNFVYAIECALRGIDWRLLEAERKLELKAQAQYIDADVEAAEQR